jgi:hypothetical protein
MSGVAEAALGESDDFRRADREHERGPHVVPKAVLGDAAPTVLSSAPAATRPAALPSLTRPGRARSDHQPRRGETIAGQLYDATDPISPFDLAPDPARPRQRQRRPISRGL